MNQESKMTVTLFLGDVRRVYQHCTRALGELPDTIRFTQDNGLEVLAKKIPYLIEEEALQTRRCQRVEEVEIGTDYQCVLDAGHTGEHKFGDV